MARMLTTVAKLTLAFALAGAAQEVSEGAFENDDECLASDPGGAGCALSALQLRGLLQASEEAAASLDGNNASAESLPESSTQDDDDIPEVFSESDASLSAESSRWHGWSQGGDKMWGGGAGIEQVNFGNAGYYDRGMYAAHSRCGGSGCAYIVNPPHHRSVNHFHIHFVHYHSYGANLKRELEGTVCDRSGWHHAGPCHGRAAFFPGFPGVFHKALTGGSIAHACLVAFPRSCGGSGTIILLAYHCSIEHQIRGDYNPHFR